MQAWLCVDLSLTYSLSYIIIPDTRPRIQDPKFMTQLQLSFKGDLWFSISPCWCYSFSGKILERIFFFTLGSMGF